jgi:hypothetical protein
MPTVSSPVLLDHAIGAVFEDFGPHPVKYVRTALIVIREEFGGDKPVSQLIHRCLHGAVLNHAYASLTLNELWVVLDEKEQQERQLLCRRFSEPVPAQA